MKDSERSKGQPATPGNQVQPWPAWLRYAVIVLLIAVVVFGLAHGSHTTNKAAIIRIVIVAVAIPAILLPLQYLGVRRRAERLSRALTQQLGELGPQLAQERSLAQAARPTAASDASLDDAQAVVRTATERLRAGQAAPATASVESLGKTATDSWAPRAPLTRAVADAARTAHTLGVLARRVSNGRH